MVTLNREHREEVVEKFKHLILFENCLYCHVTLTPHLVEVGQVSTDRVVVTALV